MAMNINETIWLKIEIHSPFEYVKNEWPFINER